MSNRKELLQQIRTLRESNLGRNLLAGGPDKDGKYPLQEAYKAELARLHKQLARRVATDGKILAKKLQDLENKDILREARKNKVTDFSRLNYEKDRIRALISSAVDKAQVQQAFEAEKKDALLLKVWQEFGPEALENKTFRFNPGDSQRNRQQLAGEISNYQTPPTQEEMEIQVQAQEIGREYSDLMLDTASAGRYFTRTDFPNASLFDGLVDEHVKATRLDYAGTVKLETAYEIPADFDPEAELRREETIDMLLEKRAELVAGMNGGAGEWERKNVISGQLMQVDAAFKQFGIPIPEAE